MKRLNEDVVWSLIEPMSMGLLGGGICLRFGIAWALMYWGAHLLYLADQRARRLRTPRKDDSV